MHRCKNAVQGWRGGEIFDENRLCTWNVRLNGTEGACIVQIDIRETEPGIGWGWRKIVINNVRVVYIRQTLAVIYFQQPVPRPVRSGILI